MLNASQEALQTDMFSTFCAPELKAKSTERSTIAFV